MYRAPPFVAPAPQSQWTQHGRPRPGVPLLDRRHSSGAPGGPGARRPLEQLMANQRGPPYTRPFPRGRGGGPKSQAMKRRAARAKAKAQRQLESVQPPAEGGQVAVQPPAEVGLDAVQPPAEGGQDAVQPPAEGGQVAVQPPVKVDQDAIQPPVKVDPDAVQPPVKVDQDAIQPPVKVDQDAIQPPVKVDQDAIQPPVKVDQDAIQPPAEGGQDAVLPPVQGLAPPEPCSNGVTMGAGGLEAVDIVVAGMAPGSVVQPSMSTPPPRASPAEAAEATWLPSAPAGRPVKKGVRRCGEGVVAAAGAACSSTGLLSSAAALPTASAAGEVFHFEATAESNAAVATASTAAAAPNAKKRAAADDDVEVVDLTAAPTGRPAVDAIAIPAGRVRPRAKRARLDVIDFDLDKVIELLVGSGAQLVYRTGAATPKPLLEQMDWTLFPETPDNAVNNPLRYVSLDRPCHEFQRIRADFENTCHGQGFQVTRVCRVENDRLLHEFQQRVRRLEWQCGNVAVLRVYHGTHRANIHSIALRNLDRRHAGRGTNHAWWGEGVYFSPISYYASHYGDQGTYRSMLVCDMVVGRACSARRTLLAPPLPGQPGHYDTNVKLPMPQVLCKFFDHEFYPAYIIDYNAPPRGHRGYPELEEGRQWWYDRNFDLLSGLWVGSFRGLAFY